MPKSTVCNLCGVTVGKSEYIHSATTKHISMLKKWFAEKKKESVEKNGYFKY
jgi:hypothetical protein